MNHWRSAVPATFAVLGDPISQSLSPRMHAAMYAAAGYDYTYLAWQVPLAEFDDAIAHLTSLGYRGVNCTTPLKKAAFEWCQGNGTLETSAKTLNALDLVGKRGTNTDVPAFLSTLRAFTAGKRVLVLGAGGTAAALFPALLADGYDVSAWNRTPDKLDSFAGVAKVLTPSAVDFDVVVNTTSAGLQGEAPPVDWAGTSACAYDVGYAGDGLTLFLRMASAAGLRVCDGRAMLVEQGALSFEWWTGQNAFRDVMTEAIQNL